MRPISSWVAYFVFNINRHIGNISLGNIYLGKMEVCIIVFDNLLREGFLVDIYFVEFVNSEVL